MVDEPRLAVLAWRAGQAPRDLETGQIAKVVHEREEIVWLDSDPRTQDALREVAAVLPNVTAAVIDELLTDSEEPTTKDGVRIVPWLWCEPASTNAGTSTLEVFPVRIAAGEGWLMTVRNPSFEAATSTAAAGEPLARERLIRACSEAARHQSDTGDDVATLLIAGLSESFEEAEHVFGTRLSQLAMERWASGGVVDAERRLKDLGTRIVWLLLRLGRLERRGSTPATAWFSPTHKVQCADQVRALVSTTRAGLAAQREEANLALGELRSEREQQLSTVTQTMLGVLAALFLGPTLLATLISAFPGWLPRDHRAEALAGLSLAAAGLTGLVVWLTRRCLNARFERPKGKWLGAVFDPASTVGVLAVLALVAVSVLWATPLSAKSDEAPPQLTVTCPAKAVEKHGAAYATVAASDADSDLVRNPSGRHQLDTSVSGYQTYTAYARDEFGRAASQACVYRIK